MLVLNEVNKLGCIGLTYKLERLNLKRCGKSSDDIHCLLASEGFLEEFSCISDTAFCDILLSKTHAVKLFKYFFFYIRTYGSGIGNLKSKLFDLFFFEMLKYTRTSLGSQCDKQYCGFLKPAYFR